MPELTCPRCHAEVPYDEGQQPICPACGLGAREEDMAAHHEETPHFPGAVDAVPITGSGGAWKMPAAIAAGVVAVALIAWAVFAAVGSSPGALDQEEAEAAALLAMQNLADDFDDPDGGDLRALHGDFSFDDPEFGGTGTFTMEVEWGRGDTGHFLVEVATTGGFSFSFAMEAYCSPERDVLVYGGVAYESRPDPDAACMDLLTGDDGGDASFDDPDAFDDDLGGLFAPGDLPDDANMTVTPHADGSVTATFADGDGSYTLEVDAQGRARSLTVDSPQGSGTFDVDYGSRRTIAVPEAEERIPSDVSGYCFFFEKTCTMTLSGGDEAPLKEFEVRVYAADAEVGVDAPEDVFPVFVGNASRNGFTFLIDEDGDGLLGDGDTITVEARSNDYQVVIWDTWAGRDVRDVPVPGVGPAALLAGLGALALVRRGRRLP